MSLLTFKSIESIKKRLAVLGIFYLYFYIVMEEKRKMKINGRSSTQCYRIVVYVMVHDKLEIKHMYNMLWNPIGQILHKQNRLLTAKIVVNVEVVLL